MSPYGSGTEVQRWSTDRRGSDETQQIWKKRMLPGKIAKRSCYGVPPGTIFSLLPMLHTATGRYRSKTNLSTWGLSSPRGGDATFTSTNGPLIDQRRIQQLRRRSFARKVKSPSDRQRCPTVRQNHEEHNRDVCNFLMQCRNKGITPNPLDSLSPRTAQLSRMQNKRIRSHS